MRPGADQEGQGVTIAAAADALGISENAVRQRIKRQSLPAQKVAGIWRVWVPDHQGDQSRDQEAGYQPDQEATSRTIAVSPAAMAQLEAIRDQWLQPLVDQLKGQAEEIGRLKAERDAIQWERDRLAAQAPTERASWEELTRVSAERDVLKAENTALRASHDQQPGVAGRQGKAIRSDPDVDASPASAPQRGTQRSWWRRLFGGG